MINEFRRARRRKASDMILVTDLMTERMVGHIGNLSESGMLLIANETLVDDALYQFQFFLPDAHGKMAPVEAGVHLLWLDPASAPGQAWTGFRFIAVAEPYMSHLRAWIEAPGGQYE
ncbi:MAG: PilZ domain-containing protein [Luteimonas sp.]